MVFVVFIFLLNLQGIPALFSPVTAHPSIYKNSGFHIPLPVLQMRNSSNQIYFTLGFFSKYDSADVVVVLVWFVFFSDFKRDKFKALQGHQAKHTLRFFKALSQYTMYDIYAQWFGLCLEY